MSRPRLLIVSFSPIASDARVLKQVVLFKDAYEVTTCGYGPAPDGVVEHLEVPSELAVWRYDRALVVARQYRRAYWSNAAIRSARELIGSREFDVVLANDVDAVGLALDVRAKGVHADLHEYSPLQKEDVRKWRWFVAPFVRWMCRTHVARADSVTTVGQGIADEYRREFGFRPGVVTNAAPFAELEPTGTHDPIRLVHSGAALRDRQLEKMITAVDASDGRVTLDLYLTLNDPGYVAELQALQSERVVVHPPVPYEQLVTTLNRYDVGVFVLPPVNFSYEWALPNKFFDYVQARLGVIVGPSPEVARYVQEYELGVVTDDFTVDSLADVIAHLTQAGVDAYKRSADVHAHELSSESQVAGWKAAVDRLAQRSFAR